LRVAFELKSGPIVIFNGKRSSIKAFEWAIGMIWKCEKGWFYALRILVRKSDTMIVVGVACDDGVASAHRRRCEATDDRREDLTNPRL
jgi:hypothetical protein